MAKRVLPIGSQRRARIRGSVWVLPVSAVLMLAPTLPANAIEVGKAQCGSSTANPDAAIASCSSIIQTEQDHHRLATAYFNRAGWHLKKNDVDRALADLTDAINFEPGFAAALTRRGLLYEERYRDVRSARADFSAVLKLPETNALSGWAHTMARERLAATEPTLATSTPSSGAAASDSSQPSLAAALEECNAKPPVAISLPGGKSEIQLNQCYQGREHLSCTVSALLAEANSIKQDYAGIVSTDYPNLRTLDSICQIPPDRLAEDTRAIQTFNERWKLLRKEYAARAECTNSVEDSLRSLSLADMSYAADIVKAMIESVRSELTNVSQSQKDVLNLADKMEAAQKALATIVEVRNGVCR